MSEEARTNTSHDLDRLTVLFDQVLAELKTIDLRLRTLEDQLDMASVVDIDGALEDVRAEVRSIKDEML